MPGTKSLVKPSVKCFTESLHIKLDILKQFTKALPKDGACFQYLTRKFLKISREKLKEGMFVRSQIQKLIKDNDFENTMTVTKKSDEVSFKEAVAKFLYNHKDPNYILRLFNELRIYWSM